MISSSSNGTGPGSADRRIIAPDAQDRTQLVAHTFTTPAPPPSELTGNDPDPGCGAGCITTASLEPGTSDDTVDLELDDHHDERLVSLDGDDFPRFTSIISFDPIV